MRKERLVYYFNSVFLCLLLCLFLLFLQHILGGVSQGRKGPSQEISDSAGSGGRQTAGQRMN